MKRLILAIVVAMGLAVAGCTSAPAGEAKRNPTFNETDVMFLQMMIAHHSPADEMLTLARSRATREDIKTLAAAVQVTQADETRTMTGWLRSWGEPLVSTAGADAHAAHGGAIPPGDAEIEVLKEASNADFDKVFITIFSGYQQTAVTLARMEINGGSSSNALDLAQRVDKNRRAQIELMATWTGGS
ncbi:MAG TPA: DUF305 domain-containing protein [Candidatus Limnocylindrales bacterium]|nr:DUF305 domain-containing protein [Candidatus Limnocylindrales bacterium]